MFILFQEVVKVELETTNVRDFVFVSFQKYIWVSNLYI